MSGANAPQSGEDGRLATAVEDLAEHVQLLREAVDELRSAIRWGLQNERFAPTDELCDQVSAAARETIKEESAGMRDAMDQLAIDAQFAARKIREKPSGEWDALRETLQGEIVDLRGSVEQFMAETHDAVLEIHNAVRREKQGTLFDPCITEPPRNE